VNVFNFSTRVWSQTLVEGCNPIPRDSHVSVIYGNSMFIYGGSTGSATDDFQELRLFPGRQMWVPIRTDENGSETPSRCSNPGEDGSGHFVIDGLASINSAASVTDFNADSDYMSPVRIGGGTVVGVGSGNLIGFSRTGYHGIPPPPPPPPPPRLQRQANQLGANSSDLLPGSRFCHVACVYDDALYVIIIFVL